LEPCESERRRRMRQMQMQNKRRTEEWWVKGTSHDVEYQSMDAFHYRYPTMLARNHRM